MPRTPDIVEQLREISVCVPNVNGPVADYVNALNENGTAAQAANIIEELRRQVVAMKEEVITFGARTQKAEREVARLQGIMLDDTERERWIVEWDETQTATHVRTTKGRKPRTAWDLICIVDDENQALKVGQIALELLHRRHGLRERQEGAESDAR